MAGPTLMASFCCGRRAPAADDFGSCGLGEELSGLPELPTTRPEPKLCLWDDEGTEGGGSGAFPSEGGCSASSMQHPLSSWQPAFSTVLELDSISAVPSLDYNSPSDPYVKVRLLREGLSDGPSFASAAIEGLGLGAPGGAGAKGQSKLWPPLNNARMPVWRARRLLDAPLTVDDGAHPDDELLISVFDQDPRCVTALFGLDFVGSASVRASALGRVPPGEAIRLPLRLSARAQAARLREQEELWAEAAAAGAKDGVGDSAGKAEALCGALSCTPSSASASAMVRRRRKQWEEALSSEPTVTLRRWPSGAHLRWPRRKWIFLVRHAESKWNAAERSFLHERRIEVGPLLREVDHSLTPKGIEQALSLAAKVEERSLLSGSGGGGSGGGGRSSAAPGAADAAGGACGGGEEDLLVEELHRRFMATEAIWVSPFCRALQTALLALQHHPAARRLGFVLRSELRERKTVVGRDTLATVQGEEVVEKALAQLEQLFDAAPDLAPPPGGLDAVLERARALAVDSGNTRHDWWDERRESVSSLEARLQEALVQMKFSPEPSFLLVTHSLLIKRLVRRFFVKLPGGGVGGLVGASPELLARKKMPNCGVLALHVDFTRDVSECIDQAVLLFGTEPPASSTSSPSSPPGGAPNAAGGAAEGAAEGDSEDDDEE